MNANMPKSLPKINPPFSIVTHDSLVSREYGLRRARDYRESPSPIKTQSSGKERISSSHWNSAGHTTRQNPLQSSFLTFPSRWSVSNYGYAVQSCASSHQTVAPNTRLA